jgi:endonuclease III
MIPSQKMKTQKIDKVFKLLKDEYPASKTSLDFSGPLELLVAVMLSAQCTDKRVNIVTKELFRRYRTAQDYRDSDMEELKALIRSTGFYNSKAKHIKEACRIIAEQHSGKVPDTMDDLVKLPGVARKTANIVLSEAFGKNEGIAIDTHMIRVNFRLGLTKHKDPVKIEQELMKLLPRERWYSYTHLIIFHGRAVCKAPIPHCGRCILSGICPKAGVKNFKE